jgi:hypothetical protein
MPVRRVQRARRHGVITDDGRQFQRSLPANVSTAGVNIGVELVLLKQFAGEPDEQRVTKIATS